MTVQFPGGGTTPTNPGPRRVELPAVKTTQQPDSEAPPVPELKIPDAASVEQARAEAVKQAAQSLFKDYFAVADTTFSIFKDSSGQLITRFTSLRDGTVTYIPEPKLLQLAGRAQAGSESLVQIQV